MPYCPRGWEYPIKMSSSSWPVATVANVVESEIHRIPIGRHKTHYKEKEGEELEALNKVYQNGTIA